MTFTCPLCHHLNTSEAALGVLGSLIHLRCRHCGGQWSKPFNLNELEETQDDDDDF